MPQLPTYTSRAPLDPGTRPAIIDTTTARRTADTLARDFEQVGNTFFQVSEQQKQIRQAQEASALALQGSQKLSELQARYANDTAPDAPRRFEAEALALRGEVLGQTHDTAVQRLVERDFGRLALAGSVEVRRAGVRRVQQEGRANLDNQLTDYAQLAAQATNPAELALVTGGARAAIAGAAATGLLNPEEAGKRERAFLGRVDQVAALGIMQNDPAAAARALNDPRQFQNLDPLLRERLSAQAGRQADAAFSRGQALETRARERAADDAGKDFNDALRSGNQGGATDALNRLRASGHAGAYAEAADKLYGLREPPTTPQMESWVEERLRSRDRPLTRDELETARASRSINDTVFRNGLSRLAAREDAAFREAEDFVGRALQVPSGAIADRDLQPWQREARNQANGIVNDLMLARRENPSIDALGFVRERLTQGNPTAVIEQRKNTAAMERIPAEFRTAEGFQRLQQDMANWQQYRGLGFFSRQGATTVRQPASASYGPVSLDDLTRWKTILDGAGVLSAPAATR